MKIQLTNNLILVRRILEEEHISHGGIVMPDKDEYAKSPWKGIVIATGPGKVPKLSAAAKEIVTVLEDLIMAVENDNYLSTHFHPLTKRARQALNDNGDPVHRIPMQVKVGDTIIFSQHGFQKFRIEGEDLLAFTEESVLGVLN